MFPSQGGILVPAIVKPPAGIFTANFQPGSFNRSFTTCMDLAPTVLDMLNITLPVDSADVSGKKIVHRGRAAHRMTGYSWLKHFTGALRAKEDHDEVWTIYPRDKPIGWELHAQAALRKGPFKIVHLRERYGGAAKAVDDPQGWELFDVEADPGETVNLADNHPDKLAELLADWDEYAEEMGLVWGANALEAGLSREEAPEMYDDDLELQRTWMSARAGQRPQI